MASRIPPVEAATTFLASFDSELSDAFVAALESLYLIDEHEMLDAFIQKALYPYGGFLAANYCEGGQDDF